MFLWCVVITCFLNKSVDIWISWAHWIQYTYVMFMSRSNICHLQDWYAKFGYFVISTSNMHFMPFNVKLQAASIMPLIHRNLFYFTRFTVWTEWRHVPLCLDVFASRRVVCNHHVASRLRGGIFLSCNVICHVKISYKMYLNKQYSSSDTSLKPFSRRQ